MRARSEFVDQQLTIRAQEEFDAEDADVLQAFEDRAGDLHGLARHGLRNGRGRRGHVEDVIAMTILEQRIVSDRPVESTRRDHRYLGLQRNELLDHRFLTTDGGPEVLDVRRRGDLVLALAVVTEGGGLDYSRRADPGDA